MLLARVRIHGREHIPEGGFILAANHPSQLDAFFVAVALGRRVRFMGKSELFNGRWGRWMARMGAFPVQRGVWDADAFETSATLLEQGKVLCMFYEGGLSPVEGGYRAAKPGIGHVAQLRGSDRSPVPPDRHAQALPAVDVAEDHRDLRRATARRAGCGTVARVQRRRRAEDRRRGRGLGVRSLHRWFDRHPLAGDHLIALVTALLVVGELVLGPAVLLRDATWS